MQLLEVVTGHSQFLSHFSIPQAMTTQPVTLPAYRPGQIQVVGERFQNGAKLPIENCKSHCELGRPRLLSDLPVSIQYWFWESASCNRDGGLGWDARIAATRTTI